MIPRTILVLLLLGLVIGPALAKEDGKDEKPVVEQASNKKAKQELKIFDHDFDTVDIDFKLDALKRLGKCVHKDVTKRLLAILFRDPDPYVRAEAAKGLGNQIPDAVYIGRKTESILEDSKADPKVLAALVRTMGKLDYRKSWEAIVDLICHDDDDVVIAAFFVLGEWKELRAHYEIEVFWNMYPDEGKWTTGSVNVDTGADSATEQRLAKAKWKAKYGGRAKQRARPECVKALKACVEKMTGKKLEKVAEYREWCKEHKREIKAAERRRD